MTQTKKLNRREFIRDAGLVLALGYIGQNVYEERTYDKNVQEIYHTLDKYVRKIKTDINIRKGNVSDINGWNGEEHLFGHDIPLVGGDSGTPVIGVDGNELKIVGVNKMRYHGVLSYGIKMLEFEKVK